MVSLPIHLKVLKLKFLIWICSQWAEQVEEWSIDKMWAPALAAFERYWYE